MDEVLGDENYVSTVNYQKTSHATSDQLPNVFDQIVWYARNKNELKFRRAYQERPTEGDDAFASRDMASAGAGASTFEFEFQGRSFHPGRTRHWKVQRLGLERAGRAGRLFATTNSLRYRRYDRDFPVTETHNAWTDTLVGSFHENAYT